jgi:hypothetical protein
LIRVQFLLVPLLLALGLTTRLWAADFEIGPQDQGGATQSSGPASGLSGSRPVHMAVTSDYPVRLDAGDVPTAYGLDKYALRVDMRFYDGGGILTKAYLGLFPRLFIGGAADLRGAIGSGPLSMTRDDAQLLARLLLLLEDDDIPAVAIGYDGPAYEHGPARGLYLAVSKEFPTSLAYVQVHGGLNTGQVDQFNAQQDLRGSLAITTAISNVGLFSELDEIMEPVGPRWNSGIELNFDPIVVAVEVRDLGAIRPDTPVSRLLRLSYNGRF